MNRLKEELKEFLTLISKEELKANKNLGERIFKLELIIEKEARSSMVEYLNKKMLLTNQKDY